MNATSTGIIPGTTGNKFIAGGIILFIAVIVMFALNTKYQFLPAGWDVFKLLGLSTSQDATYWTDPNLVSTLSITAAELPPNFPTRYGYSMMFDTMIYNSRASFSNTMGGILPYRHLLHRGSNDLGNPGTTGGCAGGGSSAGTTAKTGLPQYMNPGFMGDPSTNDILVFIDTSAGRESTRISNLQLATPYRIGIIVYQGFFEIYLGCRLLTTQLLKGTPIAITPSTPPTSGVYGLSGSFTMSAKIQNLRVWSMNLPVQQVVRECSVPMKPFGPAPPCIIGGTMNGPPTAASPTGSDTSATTTIADITKCAPTPPRVPPPPPPIPAFGGPSSYFYDATNAFNKQKQYLYEQQLKKDMLYKQQAQNQGIAASFNKGFSIGMTPFTSLF